MQLSKIVFDDITQIGRYTGRMLVNLTHQEKPVYIAISGGSTPQDIFDLLVMEFSDAINWSMIHLFWVDERCVAPDHEQSNYGMTYRHLLSKVPVPKNQVYRIKGELPPVDALSLYIQNLQQVIPESDGIPLFDLILLGMGDDGHTASIFPHEITLWSSPNLCEIAHHPETGQKRITLTGKVINHAKSIIFLVTGTKKSSTVQAIFQPKNAQPLYPASLVNPTKSKWLIDKDAAQLIE